MLNNKKRYKVFYAFLITLLFFGILFKYVHFIVQKDFIIFNQVNCDKTKDNCFISVCDTGSSECDNSTYKKIYKKAFFVKKCNGDENCLSSCGYNEDGCELVFCSADTLIDGEMCFE